MTERNLLDADSIPARVAELVRFVVAVITTYNCYRSRGGSWQWPTRRMPAGHQCPAGLMLLLPGVPDESR